MLLFPEHSSPAQTNTTDRTGFCPSICPEPQGKRDPLSYGIGCSPQLPIWEHCSEAKTKWKCSWLLWSAASCYRWAPALLTSICANLFFEFPCSLPFSDTMSQTSTEEVLIQGRAHTSVTDRAHSITCLWHISVTARKQQAVLIRI